MAQSQEDQQGVLYLKSVTSQPTEDGEGEVGTEEVDPRKLYEQVMLIYEKLMKSPFFRKTLKLVQKPGFMDKALSVYEHHNARFLIWVELFFLAVIMGTRELFIQRIDKWTSRVGFRLFMAATYAVGATWVIPRVLFGSNYTDILKMMFEVYSK